MTYSLFFFVLSRIVASRFLRWNQRNDLTSEIGTVKLTDLRTYSASWTLHKLLILRSISDRFRLQNPSIPLNLIVPSKGFCSFLDQLRQDLPWYSLFQIWVHLIILARFSFLFLENPVPDLCLSDPRPDQKLQKKSYTTLVQAC